MVHTFPKQKEDCHSVVLEKTTRERAEDLVSLLVSDW
jgi:hypothetical protein